MSMFTDLRLLLLNTFFFPFRLVKFIYSCGVPVNESEFY